MSFIKEPPVDFESRCEFCHAFCCVATKFSESDLFPFNRQEGMPCKNLDENNRCLIHEKLIENGFKGCVEFECYGAGQKVVQEFFPDCNWRDNPERAKEIYDVFFNLKAVHELLFYLYRMLSLCTEYFANEHVYPEIEYLRKIADDKDFLAKDMKKSVYEKRVQDILDKLKNNS